MIRIRIRYAGILAALLVYAAIYFLGYLVGGAVGLVLGGVLLFYDYSAPNVKELLKKSAFYSLFFVVVFNVLLSLRYLIACSTGVARFLCQAPPMENGLLFSPDITMLFIMAAYFLIPSFVIALLIGFGRRLVK